MNLRDAIIVLLEATREMGDEPQIRAARRRLEKRAEALRLKRERMSNQTRCGNAIKAGKLGVYFCTAPKGHSGPHEAGCIMWDHEGFELTEKP